MSKSRMFYMTISLCLVFSALFSFGLFAAEDISLESAGNLGQYPEISSVYDIDGLEEDKDESIYETENPDLEEFVPETHLVFDYFGYTKTHLIEMVEANAVNFSLPVLGLGESQAFRRTELKKFGDLVLTTGFNKERITTFSNIKYLEGQAPAGTAVGIVVFHFDEETLEGPMALNNIVITQEELTAVGASEIYSETIELDYIGVNYVLIATYNPETEKSGYRLFKVCREQEVKRVLLENVQIDFFDEEDEDISIENFVPGIVDFDF